jgi:hypothetical protein
MSLRIAPVLLGICGLSACVPFPHNQYYAPALEGVVTNGGQPISNTELRIKAKFSDKQQQATTDEHGAFHTQAIKEFVFFAWLIGDPLFGYTVTISGPGPGYTGFDEFSVGYAPKELKLVCDLSAPIETQSRKQYCHVAERSS